MNYDIGSLLLNLETVLEALNSPILQHLEDGLSDTEITRYETETRVVFTPEIRELFKWKNGTRLSELHTIGEQSLFGFGIFYSAQDVVKGYRYFYPNDPLKKDMLPIFGSGGGDYLLVNANQNSGTVNMVYLYSPAILYSEAPTSYCDSLSSLVSCVNYCYENSIYRFSPNEPGLIVDHQAEHEVFKINNPRSSFWRM